MNLTLTASEAAFRDRLRSWLHENAPTEPLPDEFEARHAALIQWWRRLHGAGFLGLSWPSDYGGQGLNPMAEATLNEELGRIGAPPPPTFGYIGRPILAFGTEQQKQRYLPPMIRCDEFWCQGFSEPEAGSDLANIQVSAVPHDDGFVINGQKVWTSWAKFADFCLVLARTGREPPKHAGVSAFIVDLRQPGVTVRPLVQITGDEEFAEVFFEDVHVPADGLVGALGDGWRIAMMTLSYERGPIDIGHQARYERLLHLLCRRLEETGAATSPEIRRKVASAAAAVEVLRLNSLRTLTKRMSSDAAAGPEGSIDKLLMTATEQQLADTALAVLGVEPLLSNGHWFNDYLFSRAGSIYGGTSQIQKNILATRILGLPRGD